jgi:hypothetical protein
MPVLKNPKHELFAQKVAKGMPAGEAYRKVYGSKDKSAETAGPKLFRKCQIEARVTELQQAAADKTVFDLARTIQYIEESLLTPIGSITKDHQLAQEHSLTTGENSTTERIKMPSKEGMLDKLIKLKGWYAAEKRETTVDLTIHPEVDTALEKLLSGQ